MPELPILIFAAVLVLGTVLMLRREHHLLSRGERQTLDVQNHEGDDTWTAP